MEKVIYVNFENEHHKNLSEVDRVKEKAIKIIENLVIEKHNLINENKRLKNQLLKKID